MEKLRRAPANFAAHSDRTTHTKLSDKQVQPRDARGGVCKLAAAIVESRDARYLAVARADCVSADPSRTDRHAADQCRLSLQPVLHALSRQCRSQPHRGDVGRGRRRWCWPSSSGDAFRPSTSPAAHPSSMPTSAVSSPARATWASSVMDRCNLTILEVPGQEDLAEFLRDRQVEIVASMPCYLRGQCRPPARQGRVRRLDPWLAAPQRAGLRPRRHRPHAQSRLQSAGAVAAARAGSTRGRLQARARRALRRRVQPALHARQHADPALRRDPDRARASSTAISTCCNTPMSMPTSTR